MALQIGQIVWIKDENRREYRAGQSGPIFRKYFQSRQIVGETSASWVLSIEGYKIDKKTGRLRCPNRDGSWYALSGKIWLTEADVDLECWFHDHRSDVARAVQHCTDAQVIRDVADLLIKAGQLTQRDL